MGKWVTLTNLTDDRLAFYSLAGLFSSEEDIGAFLGRAGLGAGRAGRGEDVVVIELDWPSAAASRHDDVRPVFGTGRQAGRRSI